MNKLNESSCVVCAGLTQKQSLLDVEPHIPVYRVQVTHELRLPNGVTVPETERACGEMHSVFGTVVNSPDGTPLRHPDGSVDVIFHVPDPGSATSQEIGLQRVPHDMLLSLAVTDDAMLYADAVRVNEPGAVHMLHSPPLNHGVVNENCWMHTDCLHAFSAEPQQKCPGCRRGFVGMQHPATGAVLDHLAAEEINANLVHPLFAPPQRLAFGQMCSLLIEAMGDDADTFGDNFPTFRSMALEDFPTFWTEEAARPYHGFLLLWAISCNNNRVVHFLLRPPRSIGANTGWVVPPDTHIALENEMLVTTVFSNLWSTYHFQDSPVLRQRMRRFVCCGDILPLCTALLFTSLAPRLTTQCVLQTLWLFGADVNQRHGPRGITPLITAIAMLPACAAARKMQFLLYRGAEPSRTCAAGFTPLYYALLCYRIDASMSYVHTGLHGQTQAETDAIHAVKSLTNSSSSSSPLPDDAHVNAPTSCHSNNHTTPLAIVAPLSNPFMLFALMHAGFGARVDVTDAHGMHALFEATKSPSLNSMHVLLYNGIDPAQLNTQGQTVLMHMLSQRLKHACHTRPAVAHSSAGAATVVTRRVNQHQHAAVVLSDSGANEDWHSLLGMDYAAYDSAWCADVALQRHKVCLLLAYGVDTLQVDMHGQTALSLLQDLCTVDPHGQHAPLIALVQEWSSRRSIPSLPEHAHRTPRGRHADHWSELAEIRRYHADQTRTIMRLQPSPASYTDHLHTFIGYFC